MSFNMHAILRTGPTSSHFQVINCHYTDRHLSFSYF